MDAPVVDAIGAVIAAEGAASQTAITNLQVWRVAATRHACALSLVTHHPELTPERGRPCLSIHDELAQVPVEIQRCDPA